MEIKLTPDEAMLLSSFQRFPELISGYSDLTQVHFSGELAWILYQAMITADVDAMRENPYHVTTNLTRNKKVPADVMSWSYDDFGVIPFSHTADEAYMNILEAFEVIAIKNKMAQTLQLATITELQEAIADLSTNPFSKEKPMESIVNVQDHSESCGFDFGLPELDRKIDIEKTDLVIIAARPFSGKTTFAVQLALELTRFGKIHFWSMEMSKARIKDKVEHYGERYTKSNFMIRETYTTTLQRIYRIAMKERPVAIFIDQLNKVQGKGQKEYEQFTSIARGLKELSGLMHIPIFCLAQINRDAQNGRPNLFNLKGSGSIEEEADVVLLLHIPESGKTIIQLDKNRTRKGYVAEFDIEFSVDAQIYSNCYKRSPKIKQIGG